MHKMMLTSLFLSGFAAAQVTMTDADGKPFTIKDTSRVITLGGPVTEIVFALGAGDRIIATDTSSLYPSAVTKLPKIGYQRTLTAEGIISLKPTLVIGTTEAGPPSTIAQLRSAGVPVLILPVEYTPEGTKAKINAIAKVFGEESKAAELNAGIDRDLAKARALFSRFKSQPKVMFIYARGPQGAQIGGTDTAADAMIKLAGGVGLWYGPFGSTFSSADFADFVLLLQAAIDLPAQPSRSHYALN